MSTPLRIFVDSDAVVSSLLSSSGAANYLLDQPNLFFIISDISYQEIKTVVERLGLAEKTVNNLVEEKLKIVKLGKQEKSKEKFFGYVTDAGDAHIVEGAVRAKARFLISYNVRHFRVDKIKSDFGILLFTPAHFLQYLRSL